MRRWQSSRWSCIRSTTSHLALQWKRKTYNAPYLLTPPLPFFYSSSYLHLHSPLVCCFALMPLSGLESHVVTRVVPMMELVSDAAKLTIAYLRQVSWFVLSSPSLPLPLTLLFFLFLLLFLFLQPPSPLVVLFNSLFCLQKITTNNGMHLAMLLDQQQTAYNIYYGALISAIVMSNSQPQRSETGQLTFPWPRFVRFVPLIQLFERCIAKHMPFQVISLVHNVFV